MAQSYEEMDAIAMLKADHRKVEEIFEQFEKARGADRKRQLAEQACLELPAFRDAAPDRQPDAPRQD